MKLVYIAHVIEIALITFLCLYIFVLSPTWFQPNSFPTSNLNLSRQVSWESGVNSTQDVFDDLTSLGCRLVNASAEGTKLDSIITVNNYSDFRWIASNTKLVFYISENGQVVYCFTLYQGLPIGYPLIFPLTTQEDGVSFTKYEKLEFTTAYATKSGTTFTIHLTVKNTGSATATIDVPSILFNGKPASGYTNAPTVSFVTTTLNPGASTTGTINLTESSEWVSGMTVEIMIHTTAGKDYPKVIVLP